MDSYDDDIRRQQYHPSHSIPDAAYPDDSPFRQQQLQLQTPYGPGGFGAGPSHASSGISPLSSHVGSQPVYQPQHQPQPQHQGAWAPYDIPSSPPPPYDPSQAPSAYQYPQIDAATLATPATHPNARIDAHVQTGGIEMMPLQSAATTTSPTQAPPPAPGASTSALTQASHAAEDPYKLDAAAAERRRKQRRFKLCIIVLAVIFIFFGALIIGVALGVVKGALNKPDHGPDF